MALNMGMVLLFVLIVGVIAFGALFIWGLKHAIFLAVNSVIGFFALYAVQWSFLPELIINFWSVLFTAVLGIFGFVIVLILHLVGVWF